METTSSKTEIANTFSSVRTFSFEEKKSPFLDEKTVNKFLDTILSLKESLKTKSEKVNDINNSLESITWFNDIDEESLMLINDIISAAKNLHSSLVRQYVQLGTLRQKGIAKEEIKELKCSMDELRESSEDLESVFFFLPQMPDFVETTKQLSLVG